LLGFVDKSFNGGPDLLLDQRFVYLGLPVFESRYDDARSTRAKSRYEGVTVVLFLLVGRDDDERLKAESDVILDVQTLGDDPLEIIVPDRIETDLAKPFLKHRRRRKVTQRFLDLRSDLLVGRSGSRQPLCLEGKKSLIYKGLQGLLEVLATGRVNRTVGLQSDLPEKVRIGYQLRSNAVREHGNCPVDNLLSRRRYDTECQNDRNGDHFHNPSFNPLGIHRYC
jgi:hypothetical protein